MLNKLTKSIIGLLFLISFAAFAIGVAGLVNPSPPPPSSDRNGKSIEQLYMENKADANKESTIRLMRSFNVVVSSHLKIVKELEITLVVYGGVSIVLLSILVSCKIQ